MGDMPFNIHENAIYGHPLGPHFSDNVRSLHHQPDRGYLASAEEVSQSRMRAAYDETQRIVQEESYARMNERMRADKRSTTRGYLDLMAKGDKKFSKTVKNPKTGKKLSLIHISEPTRPY